MMLWYSVPEERLRVRSVGKKMSGIRFALAALLCAPLLAHAAGLGKLTVTSALGQPLRAEIEIVSLQQGEEDSLTVRLASQEAFRQAGIELSGALVGVQMAIDKRGGRPVIRISTQQPVNEPFLDVLVELAWSTGRLVREYTFLLDPVEYKGPQPVGETPAPAVAAKPAPAPAAVSPAPRTQARPLVSEPSAPGRATTGQHEVKKGDTLGAIARQNLPAGVTLNQMLIALYRANQSAFIRGNVNLVRAGRILNIPDREAIAAIGREEANQIVKANNVDFVEYKRSLGMAVAAAPAAPVREREVTGRITAKPEAPAPAEQKDQLRLSKVDPAKPASPVAKAAREDDRVARERALKEAQSRISDLEKNVSDLQKLVEMKNQQMAELEKKAAAKPAPAPAPAPAPVPAAKAPEKAAEKAPEKAVEKAPEKAAEKAPEKAAEKAPEKAAEKAPEKAAEKAPEKAAEKVAGKATKDDGKKKPAAVPPKAPEKGFFEEFIEDPIALGGLGAVVLLLGGYGAWAWRKKKKSQTQFQDSVLGAATGVGASSVFAPATPQAAATPPPPAAAVDVSQASVSGGAVAPAESDEVDPIAEADVYMAYGRDAQAEEILKEALSKDPNRTAVHAKLLEIYANRKDAKSFEQTALKLKGLTSSAGPEWDKAMALGHSIDPGNGLYGSGGAVPQAAAPAAGAAPALDFDIGGGAEAAPAAKPEAGALDFDIGGAAPAAEPATDFASGGTLKLDAKDTAAAAAGGGGLDFDLGGGDKPAAAEPAKVDPDATVAMDFDLNLDLGGSKGEPAKPAEAPIDLGGLSLDLGTPGGGGGGSTDAKWQEVATKLDLAKAYQEMGDKDGARELLNEVVKEGDAAQKSQAQQMLSSLG